MQIPHWKIKAQTTGNSRPSGSFFSLLAQERCAPLYSLELPSPNPFMASPSPDLIQRLAIKGFRDWGSRLSSGGSFRSSGWGHSRSSLQIDWIFFPISISLEVRWGRFLKLLLTAGIWEQRFSLVLRPVESFSLIYACSSLANNIWVKLKKANVDFELTSSL